MAEQARPVIPAGERSLAVPPVLANLFPRGGLQRGSIIGVGSKDKIPVGGIAGEEGSVVSSLALALISEASAQGSWCGLVGNRSLGLAAAAELGVVLDRLPVVASPPSGGSRGWAWVVATLLDGFDVVVAWAPPGLGVDDARRLRARARQRGAVLVAVGTWPDTVDVHLDVVGAAWEGVGVGHGRLRRRRVEVRARGRAWAGRERLAQLWMPTEHGALAVVDPSAEGRFGGDRIGVGRADDRRRVG